MSLLEKHPDNSLADVPGAANDSDFHVVLVLDDGRGSIVHEFKFHNAMR
jgi:L-lactate utilization protein LutB